MINIKNLHKSFGDLHVFSTHQIGLQGRKGRSYCYHRSVRYGEIYFFALHKLYLKGIKELLELTMCPWI